MDSKKASKEFSNSLLAFKFFATLSFADTIHKGNVLDFRQRGRV